MDPIWRVSLVPSPIDSTAVLGEMGRNDAGAVVMFCGTARDNSDGIAGITHLEYEVYTEHFEPLVRSIVQEAADRWPILGAVVEHRVGRVDVGEASVLVAVTAAHRGEAFEAARFIIDELKLRAPVWKREHWEGGSRWIGSAD